MNTHRSIALLSIIGLTGSGTAAADSYSSGSFGDLDLQLHAHASGLTPARCQELGSDVDILLDGLATSIEPKVICAALAAARDQQDGRLQTIERELSIVTTPVRREALLQQRDLLTMTGRVKLNFRGDISPPMKIRFALPGGWGERDLAGAVGLSGALLDGVETFAVPTGAPGSAAAVLFLTYSEPFPPEELPPGSQQHHLMTSRSDAPLDLIFGALNGMETQSGPVEIELSPINPYINQTIEMPGGGEIEVRYVPSSSTQRPGTWSEDPYAAEMSRWRTDGDAAIAPYAEIVRVLEDVREAAASHDPDRLKGAHGELITLAREERDNIPFLAGALGELAELIGSNSLAGPSTAINLFDPTVFGRLDAWLDQAESRLVLYGSQDSSPIVGEMAAEHLAADLAVTGAIAETLVLIAHTSLVDGPAYGGCTNASRILRSTDRILQLAGQPDPRLASAVHHLNAGADFLTAMRMGTGEACRDVDNLCDDGAMKRSIEATRLVLQTHPMPGYRGPAGLLSDDLLQQVGAGEDDRILVLLGVVGSPDEDFDGGDQTSAREASRRLVTVKSDGSLDGPVANLPRAEQPKALLAVATRLDTPEAVVAGLALGRLALEDNNIKNAVYAARSSVYRALLNLEMLRAESAQWWFISDYADLVTELLIASWGSDDYEANAALIDRLKQEWPGLISGTRSGITPITNLKPPPPVGPYLRIGISTSAASTLAPPLGGVLAVGQQSNRLSAGLRLDGGKNTIELSERTHGISFFSLRSELAFEVIRRPHVGLDLTASGGFTGRRVWLDEESLQEYAAVCGPGLQLHSQNSPGLALSFDLSFAPVDGQGLKPWPSLALTSVLGPR